MTSLTHTLSSLSEKLLPCPFCGSKSLTLTVNEHYWKIVECDDCGMRGQCIDLEDEEYLARWNTRAALSSPAPDRLSGEERRAVENLRTHQEQCDMDGVMVKVSRQAVDETLAIIDHLSRQPSRTEELTANISEQAQRVGARFVPSAEKIETYEAARAARQPEAEPVAWQWKHHDPISGNVVWREQQFWNGHRSTEQRALYTSPRLDREKVARIAAEIVEKLNCDWGFNKNPTRDEATAVIADAIMREAL